MNISNINNLNELFIAWKEFQTNDGLYNVLNKYCQNIAPNAFASDGIVDDVVYSNCGFHVLYVMSESNADESVKGVENQSEWDLNNEFISFSDGGKDWPQRLKTKICEMQRIILKTETGIDVGIREAAKTIAVMNLNKRGGGKQISRSYFEEYFKPYVEKHTDFIKREVEIINPDLIIWCGTNTYSLKGYVVPDIYTRKTFLMWHPSYTRISKNHPQSKNCISEDATHNAIIRKYIAEFEMRYHKYINRYINV
ncbi:MAG: hypothetical protein Q8882_01825 [Bacillota bacterium]|nr:hypothetical protein [Bacillota bacterium]